MEKKVNSSLFNIGSTSREMPSVWELRRGKEALKKKQTTAIKSQMANIWTACGWADYAAVWITKVWPMFYSVLIWLSLHAFSSFGTAAPRKLNCLFSKWCIAEDYHADFLFCFPPHFVYVLQERDLVMFDGSLHHILYTVHGMPLCINLCDYVGVCYLRGWVSRISWSVPFSQSSWIRHGLRGSSWGFWSNCLLSSSSPVMNCIRLPLII